MSTISASTTSTTAFKVTSDTTGTLVFQTGASPTTAMSISSSQIISFTNPPTATGAGSVASNTAFGTSALAANTTGSGNSAFGASALLSNQGGAVLAAFGTEALKANTSGNYNVAFAPYSLTSNTTGASNTGVGVEALRSNTTGSYSTAVGYQAAYTTNGGQITAIGYQSNLNNTGYGNTSLGYQSLYTAGGGYTNSAIGRQALYSLTSGISNTAIGNGSGYYMTTGSNNTILGSFSGNQGGLDIRTSSNNVVLSDGDGNPKAYWNSTGNLSMFGGSFSSVQLYSGSGVSGTTPTLYLNARSMGFIQVFGIGAATERMQMYYFTNCGPTSIAANIVSLTSSGFNLTFTVTAVGSSGGFTMSWSGSNSASVYVVVTYLGGTY